MQGTDCLVELDMGTAQPRFTFIMQADPVLTVCSHVGVFHSILLFLRYVQLNRYAQLGGRTLDYLNVSKVLRSHEPLYNLFAGKWFGLF